MDTLNTGMDFHAVQIHPSFQAGYQGLDQGKAVNPRSLVPSRSAQAAVSECRPRFDVPPRETGSGQPRPQVKLMVSLGKAGTIIWSRPDLGRTPVPIRESETSL
jgi:hypothetical protein